MTEWREEADGVFRGGGIKGLGLAGALLGFADHPRRPVKRWVNVAGASAGAIIAAFLAVEGDDAVRQLEPLLRDAPFGTFEDFPRGPLGAEINLLSHHGLARGEVFRTWFDGVLGGARFADVATAGGTDWRLKMTAVDVTRHKLLLLPDDLGRYRRPGDSRPIDPSTFPIADAVRMSMSIPLVFQPVPLVRDTVRCVQAGSTGLPEGVEVERADAAALSLRCRESGREGATVEEVEPVESAIVDGGTLSNFPVWIFDVDPAREGRQPERMTFGFTLTGGHGIGGGSRVVRHLPWPARFALDLVHTAQSAWDDRFVSHSTRLRTVTVDAGNVATTDFALSGPDKDALVERGRRAATRFLDEFDPSLYTNTFAAAPALAVTEGA